MIILLKEKNCIFFLDEKKYQIFNFSLSFLEIMEANKKKIHLVYKSLNPLVTTTARIQRITQTETYKS
jgi:hypothetical protein